jgi:hypothetical protein
MNLTFLGKKNKNVILFQNEAHGGGRMNLYRNAFIMS